MNNIRQTRIFIPWAAPYNDDQWAVTAIARTIAPIVNQYEHDLHWFWFSRYMCPKELDGGDCNIDLIPSEYIEPKTKFYISVRFRYSVNSEICASMEASLQELVKKSGCAISDFRDYDMLQDLGGTRHLEEPRTAERQQQRADLVAANYHSIARLILHAIHGPDADGRYMLPHNMKIGQRDKTPFRVLHHIFCNMTDVPLFITEKSRRWPWSRELTTLKRIRF